MNTIMVATDFSERSDRALRRATLLARNCGATMTIVNAVDDDRPRRIVDEERRESEALLRELCATLLSVDGVRCESRVVLDEASQAIGRAVRDMGPDLLVIGPHRRQFFRDVFIGTTAERTIRVATCPVLMVNAAPLGPYRHVLMTTDLGEGSRDALQSFKKLDFTGVVRRSILHIFDVPMLRFALAQAVTADKMDGYVDDERALAVKRLADFMASGGMTGFDPVLRPELTTTKDEILAAAADIKADLLVVATHGTPGLLKSLIGSVAEQVLRDASVDVLAVPARVAA